MVESTDNADWYRKRTYAHFDRPLPLKKAKDLCTDPLRVARHAFWPLIMRPKRDIGRKNDGNGRRLYKRKVRPITYAAHSDAHIYAYYSLLLNEQLEKFYQAEFGKCVLAYRRFQPPQCNVHFAYEAFQELMKRGAADAVALDVQGFFDTLNHDKLLLSWTNILNTDYLPDDHYAVFKSVTRDTAVLLPELRDVFRREVRRKAGRNGSPICSPAEFREKVVPLLKRRDELVWKVKKEPGPPTEGVRAGIPQGTPISATLANLYLLQVDQELFEILREKDTSYRRYSDDILLIAPIGRGKEVEKCCIDALKKVGLTVKQSKTERVRLQSAANGMNAVALDENYQETAPASLSYLGLSFDGRAIRLRDTTISRFIIRMQRAVRGAYLAAKSKKSLKIKRRKLYATLSSLGHGAAYGKWVGELPWGIPRIGFYRYLQLAESITESPAIAKQKRQLENLLHRTIERYEKRLQSS